MTKKSKDASGKGPLDPRRKEKKGVLRRKVTEGRKKRRKKYRASSKIVGRGKKEKGHFSLEGKKERKLALGGGGRTSRLLNQKRPRGMSGKKRLPKRKTVLSIKKKKGEDRLLPLEKQPRKGGRNLRL